MSRGVKVIFLTLIGTVVLLVSMSLYIEMNNLNTVSLQVQQLSRLSCKQSLILYSQETYKSRQDRENSLGGSVNMKDIKDANGATYVSGKFYNGSSAEDIYNSLYKNSPEFKDWVTSIASQGDWESINLLNEAFQNRFSVTTEPKFTNYTDMFSASTIQAYEEYEKAMDKYSDYLVAKGYTDNLMTPLNFGVPYIDEKTAETMFRWNLTEMLSDCHSSRIVPDEEGKDYISVNGFRVYAADAKITGLTYKVYNLENTSDKQNFEKLTNIDPNNLKFSTDINYTGNGKDERKRICVIGVEYSIPMAYQGITPLKKIFESVWKVQGNGYANIHKDTRNQEFSLKTANLTGGGLSGNNALPIPGKIIYYVVR